jgi:hypothetical protein
MESGPEYQEIVMPTDGERLLRMVLGWTAITFILVWLPLLRGFMDGASYVWGTNYWGISVGGSGIGGEYWLLVIQGMLGLLILGIGWRGARAPFHALLLIWHGVFGTSAVYSAVTEPEAYRFRGDTLGIDVSIAWVGPLFFGGFFLLCVLWVLKDLRQVKRRAVPAWTRTNTIWLLVLTSMLPIQFVLLGFGEDQELTDQIGVVLTIVQCLLLARIFKLPASGLPCVEAVEMLHSGQS